MRYIKDLMLERAILHVIDASADEAILASKELVINENVEEFVRKSVIKPLNSDDTYSAKFLGDNVRVSQLVKHVISNNDDFLRVSQELTTRMFEVTKNTDIEPCDLLVAQYIADEQRCFAVIRLEHQVSQSHLVEYDTDQLEIGLVVNENVLPKAGMGFKKCAFFTKATEDQIEIIVVDKTQKLEGGNEDYFTQDFLEVVSISDDTAKTREFKSTVEKWTQRNLTDQIEQANTVRAVVNDALVSDESINIKEFTDNIFGDSEEKDDIRESLKEGLADQGYREDTEFEVDKTWVDKKLKSKIIKTDTGLVIKGELGLFNDSQKFEVRNNGDGTCDYVIKNVRNVIEKKGSQ